MATMAIFLAALLAPLALGQPYQPGTPGAPWTLQEMSIVKARLFRVFRLFGWAPSAVRLGFHDCMKYKDGTGGCDGCLNWSGMEHRFAPVAHTRNETNIEEGNNNGLEGIVRHLETVYTDRTAHGSPDLDVSLRESGKSRADLWAFASIVAVEFGISTTNIACAEGDDSSRINRGSLCLHNFGEPSCEVETPRNLRFQTGRADCVERDAEFGYKAAKAEHHPSPVANGRSTIEFFRDSFGMNGREVVALMGAHTFGKPHFQISLFPYTWTSKGTNLWNNDYYKTITGRPRWFFSPQEMDNCNKVGDAFGNIPETRWLAHTRMSTKRGGPIFWIHENLVCPDCNREDVAARDPCCQNVPAGQQCRADRAGPGEEDPNIHGGCEKFRFISGADEIALNAEMGLYRDFEVTDGIIHGCPGLEIFNTTMRSEEKTTVWSRGEDGWVGEPRCELQRLEEPAGSGDPLHAIFDEYAEDQAAWMRDYVPAMEKMLANGYPEGLQDAPDTSGVICPFPDGNIGVWQAQWSCYTPEAPGPGPALVIRSDCTWGETSGRVVQAGATGEESWAFTGEPKQLWTWSQSGNQLINQGTGRPFAVGGYTEWRVDTSRARAMLVTQSGGRALDSWAAREQGCGGQMVAGDTHGGANQWFTLVPVEDMVTDPSLTCTATTTTTTTEATTPTTTPTTTPATTTSTTTTTTTTEEQSLTMLDLSTSSTCTNDGSIKEPQIFVLQNVRDSYVVALDASGNPTLEERSHDNPSQLWEFSALCSGQVVLTNIGTNTALAPGPWTYDPTYQLVRGGDGRVMRSNKKHRFQLTNRIRYIKENGQDTDQPWAWFKWNAVIAA